MIGDPSTQKKGLTIFLTVVIGLAFIGFMVGTQGREEAPGLSQFEPANKLEVQGVPARTYKQLMEEPFSANDAWQGSLDELKKNSPGLNDKVAPVDVAARLKSIEARESRRAHAGAPPVVPHKVTQADDLACMACHGEGLKVLGKTASAISHDFMTNCTQCHVPTDGPMKMIELAHSVSEVNFFEGLPEPTHGARWDVDSPPTIPHPTRMRENCMSCHGLNGDYGIRTTHPYRQSCEQCHAPSAVFDQRVLTPGLAPIGVP